MVSMGVFCFVISGIFMLILLIKKLRHFITHKVVLYSILLTGPASMLAIEFGWFLTEMGRQPWIVEDTKSISGSDSSWRHHISDDFIWFIISCTHRDICICTTQNV